MYIATSYLGPFFGFPSYSIDTYKMDRMNAIVERGLTPTVSVEQHHA